MRILHVVPSYIPAYRYGGPIRSVHSLCKGLAGRGHEVHVFTTSVDGSADSDVPLEVPVEIDGVTVWYYSSTHLRRLYWSPPMDRALTERIRNFDLLHLHSIFLWPTWAAARAARREHIPYLIAPRGMLEKELIRRKSTFVKSMWIAFIEKKNIESAAGLHMTSKREVEAALEFGFKMPPLFIISNGFEAETRAPSANGTFDVQQILQKKNVLLFLGRVNWKKGLDRLIPAMKHVPSAHLVIAGNDEENYKPILESLARMNGVSERVTFTGPIYGFDKEALLKHAAIFVLPSYSENFGNVVLEAMAVGCPVAVTSEVGAAEIVREYGAGLVLDGAPEKLGSGLRMMLEDSAELKQMGMRGSQAVKDYFTWDAIAEKMEKIYCDLLQKGAVSRRR